MKLYLKGHDYKYATEQLLLMLFPGQRPEYPAEPAAEGEEEAGMKSGVILRLLLRLIVTPMMRNF